MNVHVQLYSPLKEFCGESRLELTLPEGAAATLMLDTLAARHPVIRPYLRNAQVIIQNEMVHPLHLLHEGDEVQLRLPMFGG